MRRPDASRRRSHAGRKKARLAKAPKRGIKINRDKTTEKVFLSFENASGTRVVLGTSFALVLIFLLVVAFAGSTIRPLTELLALKGLRGGVKLLIPAIRKATGL